MSVLFQRIFGMHWLMAQGIQHFPLILAKPLAVQTQTNSCSPTPPIHNLPSVCQYPFAVSHRGRFNSTSSRIILFFYDFGHWEQKWKLVVRPGSSRLHHRISPDCRKQNLHTKYPEPLAIHIPFRHVCVLCSSGWGDVGDHCGPLLFQVLSDSH